MMGSTMRWCPLRGHGGPSGRGRPFWEAGCNCARPYMLCQFNAIQHVLSHVMNNIILWPKWCKMTAYMVCGLWAIGVHLAPSYGRPSALGRGNFLIIWDHVWSGDFGLVQRRWDHKGREHNRSHEFGRIGGYETIIWCGFLSHLTGLQAIYQYI